MSEKLPEIARRLRVNILKAIFAAQSGHPGGSLSAVEILTILFWKFLKNFPENPKNENRDFFILSKAHAAPALYSALAERGFFDSAELFKLRQIDSLLQGHPTNKIPGVEVCGGSLGQGLSVATGIAAGLKIQKKANRVFALLGDGELQEGQIWEAAMNAASQKLENLVAIVDRNNLQIDGPTREVCAVAPVAAKFKSFGWEVFETDGHDFAELEKSFAAAISVKNKPALILARTEKGRGVSFMENQISWHGKAPSSEEFEKAIAEI